MSRVKLVEVLISHTTDEIFPYTTNQLAVYMKHICDNFENQWQGNIVEEEPNFEEVYQPKFDATDPRAMAGIKTGEQE